MPPLLTVKSWLLVRKSEAGFGAVVTPVTGLPKLSIHTRVGEVMGNVSLPSLNLVFLMTIWRARRCQLAIFIPIQRLSLEKRFLWSPLLSR
jgi:hypothetical protein